MLKTTEDRYNCPVDGSTLILHFRYPTRKQARAIESAFEEAQEKENYLDEVVKVVNSIITGWTGGEGNPTYTGDVADVLTDGDLAVLRGRLLQEMRLDDIQKKGRLFVSRVVTAPSPANANPADAPPPKNPA